MSLQLAIVADDLTGALDTCVPFVRHGFSVIVATTPQALGDALATGSDVVAVSSASRQLGPSDARACVAEIGALLRAARPRRVLKKIDSRLKGNVGAETEALAVALGLSKAIVAPAVPDQGRLTLDGMITGNGVSSPMAIAPAFSGAGLALDIRDARDATALDIVAADVVSSANVLAVGARGLGAALARRLGRPAPGLPKFTPSIATLFAFGSRDPITAAQIDHLLATVPTVSAVDAPAGVLPDMLAATLPLVLRCADGDSMEASAVARRFAEGLVAFLPRLRPSVLVMGGGDTTLAVLAALGVRIVRPLGEAAPGLPWFRIASSSTAASNGEQIACVAKSGGFGKLPVLAELTGVAPAGHVLA